MKAKIAAIHHYERKADKKPISKIEFEPTLVNDEVIMPDSVWREGHLPLEWVGKIAVV